MILAARPWINVQPEREFRMSQLNVLVIHIRAEQAAEYERLFTEHELPRWRDFQRDGKFLRAQLFRTEFGTDERQDVVKYVIVVEVPSMAEHQAHDSDPEFQKFDQMVDPLQPEQPLVYGGTVLHAVGT
jgi:hypothetical protein